LSTSSISAILDGEIPSGCPSRALEVKSAEESHLILTTDGGKNELTYNMAAPLEVRLRPIEATVIDKYGTTQTQGTTPMTWMPVLRYYRLSQTRDDTFDAYRYMFLAFEALLHGLYPIKRKERERDWMLRALAKVAKKVSLGRFISGAATDPVRAFIDGQYGNVRLRLFHAKKSSQTQPHEGIPEADVARAYSDLTRFCREVLNQCYGLGGQSGVMTNVWFQNTVQANLASGVEFACSEDPSPFDPAQTKFCPQGFPSYSLHELNIDYPPASGTVRLIAALDLNDELRKLAIRRVGAVKGDTAVAVSAFDSELLLTGLDRFRCIMKLTLRNLNTPRRLD
jgi:hypothetical protein